MQRDSDTMTKTFMRQLSKRWLKVQLCGKRLYSSIWKRFQNRWEWSACFHGTFSFWCRQICSQNRNLRDRDLVKTSRPRLHTKSRDRDSDFKICEFCQTFQKNVGITSKLNFFQICGIFLTCFGCFLPANTTNKKWLYYRNFTLPVLCNNQTPETCTFTV